MNTAEASKILKVNINTIGNLIHRGVLTDISGKTGRHKFVVATKEVRALAKVYKKYLDIETLKLGMNGHLVDKPAALPRTKDTGKLVAQVIPNGIFSRLERIESQSGRTQEMLRYIDAKLDKLVKIWE